MQHAPSQNYASCLSLTSSRGLCLCTKSSTHSSISSASSVNQSHQCLWPALLEDACGALDVILADTDIEIDVPASKDELSGSRPDAEAARLDSESNTADIVAADGGGGVNECMPTGSVGVSSGKSSSSLCKPMGFKGGAKCRYWVQDSSQ